MTTPRIRNYSQQLRESVGTLPLPDEFQVIVEGDRQHQSDQVMVIYREPPFSDTAILHTDPRSREYLVDPAFLMTRAARYFENEARDPRYTPESRERAGRAALLLSNFLYRRYMTHTTGRPFAHTYGEKS